MASNGLEFGCGEDRRDGQVQKVPDVLLLKVGRKNVHGARINELGPGNRIRGFSFDDFDFGRR